MLLFCKVHSPVNIVFGQKKNELCMIFPITQILIPYNNFIINAINYEFYYFCKSVLKMYEVHSFTLRMFFKSVRVEKINAKLHHQCYFYEFVCH